jgi:ribosomal protein S5
LSLAGYQDIWAKTSGQTRQKINFVSAVMKALTKTCSTRVREEQKPLVKKGAIS